MVKAVYQKALEAIEIDNKAYQSKDNLLLYLGEVIGRIRDCLLSNLFHAGEQVTFVPTIP